MQYNTEQNNQNQNPNQQSVEEQIFLLQEQSRKSQAIQEELLAQQNSTQAMLAQLIHLVGTLQVTKDPVQTTQVEPTSDKCPKNPHTTKELYQD